MFIACNCINIIAEVDDVEQRKNMRKELRLFCIESFHIFFREEIKEAKLISVTKNVMPLVQDRKLGSWIVTKCMNCLDNCYAVNTDNGATLINPKLYTTEDVINSLRKNRDFSPAFKLLVQECSKELPKPGIKPMGKLKNILTSLQLQLRDTLRDEVQMTEERIRTYTEDQYEKLEDFQSRASKDHKALAHKIYEVVLPAIEESEISTDSENERRRKAENGALAKRHKRKTRKSRSKRPPTEEAEGTDQNDANLKIPEIPPSLDSEGLFVLEEMGDTEYSEYTDTEDELNEESKHEGERELERERELGRQEAEAEQVSESHDEGIDVHLEQTPSGNFARSLPVEIPPHPPHFYEDKDEEEVPVEGIDIAASIRALARSVHGDSIFGELPPPRLSTGI